MFILCLVKMRSVAHNLVCWPSSGPPQVGGNTKLFFCDPKLGIQNPPQGIDCPLLPQVLKKTSVPPNSDPLPFFSLLVCLRLSMPPGRNGLVVLVLQNAPACARHMAMQILSGRPGLVPVSVTATFFSFVVIETGVRRSCEILRHKCIRHRLFVHEPDAIFSPGRTGVACLL